MPQLDQFTYLPQFVWLCVFYMSFYVLLMNDGLPKLSRILKLRAQLVSQHTSPGADTITQDPKGIGTPAVNTPRSDPFGTADLHALSSGVSYLNSSVSGASQWCNDMVTTLNSNQLKPMNSVYLSSLGELGVSQVIKQSALETISPLTPRTTVLKTLQTLETKLTHTAVLLNSIYVLRAQKCILIKNGPRKKKNLNA